jgi:hypothetical protein
MAHSPAQPVGPSATLLAKVIKEIECNPNAPNNQVELCLEKRMKKIPTWILEKNGEETHRLEGYQFLEDLVSSSGCEISEVE